MVVDQILSEKDVLYKIIPHAFTGSQSMALWQLPGQRRRHLILSESPRPLAAEAIIETLPTGFIFAPFCNAKERLFLEASHSFTFDDGQLRAQHTYTDDASANWWTELPTASTVRPHPASTLPPTPHDDAFITLVEKCLAEIAEGQLEKIVPSRTKTIPLPEGFDLVETFQRLCATYPDAFISLVHIPGHGTWMGATPETLVSVEGQTIFKTVALAGTQRYQPGIPLRDVTWTQKEIEEQALVERYIISCFKKIRLRDYEEYGPKTMVAGNLMHLRSDFRVDMKAMDFPHLGTRMLNLLHPTSAVCGMPLSPARAFLNKHEGYDRTFYAGFLGPVNVEDDTHLFVNLRCMQLAAQEALLYAGAGVTHDSIPEKEWEETEIKMNTLLNVIR